MLYTTYLSVVATLLTSVSLVSAYPSLYEYRLATRGIDGLSQRDLDFARAMLFRRTFVQGSKPFTGQQSTAKQKFMTNQLQQEHVQSKAGSKPMLTSFQKPGTDNKLHYGTSSGARKPGDPEPLPHAPQVKDMMKNAANKQKQDAKMAADPNLTKSAAKKQVKKENKAQFKADKNSVTSQGKTKAEGKAHASDQAFERAKDCHSSKGGCGEHAAMNSFAHANPGVPLAGGKSYSVGSLRAEQKAGLPPGPQPGCTGRNGKLGCTQDAKAGGVRDLAKEMKDRKQGSAAGAA